MAITEALVEIAGESRENGGIVSFNPITAARRPSRRPRQRLPSTGNSARERRVRLLARAARSRSQCTSRRGAEHCTLGALWKDLKRRFTVRVADPDGNPSLPARAPVGSPGNTHTVSTRLTTRKPGPGP